MAMQIPLEKIDQLRERAGISYREAKDILEQMEGDLVEALIFVEESRRKGYSQFSEWSRDVSQQIRKTAAELHRTKVRVKVKENTLVELPATYGALGAVLFPKLAALGLIGVLFSEGSIEIDGRGSREAGEGGDAAVTHERVKENLDN